MKAKCSNCRLPTEVSFPTTKCTHCWEAIALKKTKEYVLARKVLTNYGMSLKEAKDSLKNILTSDDTDSIMDASVLVKLAFANQMRIENERTETYKV